MVTSEQVAQQVSLQVDAIEPVHRLAKPRKPHDEGGGVDVLTSATRGGSRLSHGMRRPRHGSRPLLPFGRFVLDAPAAHLSPRRNRPSPLAKPAAAASVCPPEVLSGPAPVSPLLFESVENDGSSVVVNHVIDSPEFIGKHLNLINVSKIANIEFFTQTLSG